MNNKYREFWHRSWSTLAFFIILLGSVTFQVVGAWQDSPTRDEPAHLVDGLAYWQLGSFAFNYPHPPLAKIGSGLAIYLAGARIDENSAAWKKQDHEAVNAKVLYQGRTSAEVQRLVFIGRLPVIIFWILLMWLVWWLARKQWGNIPALTATTIVAFDPSFLGHGHLVNTDVPLAAMIMALAIMADIYFRSPSRRNLIFFSLVIALTLLTKFSAVIVFPLVIGFGFLRVLFDRKTYPWKKWFIFIGVLSGITAAAMLFIYRFEFVRSPKNNSANPVVKIFREHQIPIPVYSYWRGLNYVLNHNEAGHRTMFLGKLSWHGQWQYFPVALWVKTPITTLILWFSSLGFVIWYLVFKRFHQFRHNWFRPILFIGTPAVFLGIAMAGNLNLGIRHIFPVLPFAALGVGWFCYQIGQIKKYYAHTVLAVSIITIIIAIFAWPNTIGYFNAFAGGTKNGHNYFVDSNLDWGQDMWRLRDYLKKQNITDVQIKTASMLDIKLVSAGATALPTDREIKHGSGVQLGRYAVISALMLYPEDEPYRWISEMNREVKTTRIGASLYLLDFQYPPS